MSYFKGREIICYTLYCDFYSNSKMTTIGPEADIMNSPIIKNTKSNSFETAVTSGRAVFPERKGLSQKLPGASGSVITRLPATPAHDRHGRCPRWLSREPRVCEPRATTAAWKTPAGLASAWGRSVESEASTTACVIHRI